MIYPDFLKKGDTIYVTAPSDGNSESIDYIRLDRAKAALSDRGYNVKETMNVRTSTLGRSTTAVERAAEFMEAYENGNAVISAKGGDFLMEMLSYTDFEKLSKKAAWFQGYSDNTSIGFILTTAYDVASVYCNNFNDFAMDVWHESLSNNISILEGKDVTQHSFDMYQNGFFKGETGKEGYNLTDKVCLNLVDDKYEGKNIHMRGRLIGGCLDVLLNLCGTRFDKVKDYVLKYKADGIIWFIESFSLGSEDIERGLWQLYEAGWFENVKGFVFGREAFFSTTTETDYRQALEHALSKFNVPVIMNADIGHKPPQLTMINGAVADIDYNNGRMEMKLSFLK